MTPLHTIAGIQAEPSEDVRTALVAAAMQARRAGVVLSLAEYGSMDEASRDAWDVASRLVRIEDRDLLRSIIAEVVGNLDVLHDVVRSEDEDAAREMRRTVRIAGVEARGMKVVSAAGIPAEVRASLDGGEADPSKVPEGWEPV